MKAKLLAYCREEALFSPGDRVICGLSGGSDSMALLHCLHCLEQELGITVEAAHFNHKLRGKESEGDEAFVVDFCEKNRIPLHLGAEDVEAYSQSRHIGIEEGARQCRYAFFQGLPGKIATAHTADDNAETVLMHLIRGTGLRGLCGIPSARGRIVRPLLWATKGEILAYLKREQIPYREDSSNRSLAYTRNRLRHGVLPLLQEENPALCQGVFRQSRLLRKEDQFLDDLARALLQKDPTGAFALEPIYSAPEVLQNRALRLIVGEYLEQDVSMVHIEALRQLVINPCPSARISLPQGLTACRRYDRLLLCKEAPESFLETELQIPGTTLIPGCPWKITCEVKKNFTKMTNTPFHFAVRYDMIKRTQISLRPRQEGDRLQTPNGHSKTLKKLMIDRKIPRHDRDRLPVLTEGAQILAVCGLGPDAHHFPTEGQSALILTFTSIE